MNSDDNESMSYSRNDSANQIHDYINNDHSEGYMSNKLDKILKIPLNISNNNLQPSNHFVQLKGISKHINDKD